MSSKGGPHVEKKNIGKDEFCLYNIVTCEYCNERNISRPSVIHNLSNRSSCTKLQSIVLRGCAVPQVLYPVLKTCYLY